MPWLHSRINPHSTFRISNRYLIRYHTENNKKYIINKINLSKHRATKRTLPVQQTRAIWYAARSVVAVRGTVFCIVRVFAYSIVKLREWRISLTCFNGIPGIELYVVYTVLAVIWRLVPLFCVCMRTIYTVQCGLNNKLTYVYALANLVMWFRMYAGGVMYGCVCKKMKQHTLQLSPVSRIAVFQLTATARC